MKLYLMALGGTSLAVIIIFWMFVVQDYVTIEPTDYQFTRAHYHMISQCDVGDVAVLGDSTGNADLIPSRIGPGVRVFATAGATAIEEYYEAQAILQCPNKPKAVLISFTPAVLMDSPVDQDSPDTSYFWSRGMAFHILDYGDALEVLRRSNALQDRTIVGAKSIFDIDYRVKALLYSIDFPTYSLYNVFTYVGNRLQDRKVADTDFISQTYEGTLADSGHHFFGMLAVSQSLLDLDAIRSVSLTSSQTRFQILPVPNFYFQALIKNLSDAGITVYILEPPRNQVSVALYNNGLIDIYQKYLQSLQHSADHVALLDPGFNSWSPVLFGDKSHLNLRGALTYSDIIRKALLAAGRTDLALPDSDMKTVNLYSTESGGPIFPSDAPGAKITIADAADMPPPDLRYPAPDPVWRYDSISADTPEVLFARSLSLAAGTTYATAVFVRNISAERASLQLQWPGGTSGKVVWAFKQRAISYSGMASPLNGGAVICPGGWVELFLSGFTGARSGSYPGPVVSLSAKGRAAAYMYDMSVEHGLWPTNYCKLQAGEGRTVLLSQSASSAAPALSKPPLLQ